MEKKQKKKMILINIMIIIFILILAGVLVYLFTDLFKSDRQLFYKYLLDKNEMFSILDGYELKQNTNSYIANTNAEAIYKYDDKIEELENDQIIKNLQENIKSFENLNGLKASIESRVDKKNKKQYHNIQLNKNENQIMQLDIVRNEEKYALRSEEILKAYIGIENSNIKELASKLDLPNARKFSR